MCTTDKSLLKCMWYQGLKKSGLTRYIGITGYCHGVLKKIVRLSPPGTIDTVLIYGRCNLINQGKKEAFWVNFCFTFTLHGLCPWLSKKSFRVNMHRNYLTLGFLSSFFFLWINFLGATVFSSKTMVLWYCYQGLNCSSQNWCNSLQDYIIDPTIFVHKIALELQKGSLSSIT